MTSPELGFLPARSYWGRLDALAKDVQGWQEDGDRVLLVSHHASRLTEVFQGQSISVQVARELEGDLAKGSVALFRGSLAEGWSLPLNGSTLHILTDVEIMGQVKERPRMRRAPVHVARNGTGTTGL